MKKYLFSLLLTLGVLFSLPSTSAMASSMPDGADQNLSIVSQTSYTTEAQIVKDLRAAMAARKDSVTFACDLPMSSFDGTDESAWALGERVMESAMAHTGVPDEGDYIRFHLHQYHTDYSWQISGGKIHLILTYSFTYYTTAKQEAQVKTAVANAIASLSLDGLSDHAKIQAIYTYLTENVDYDHDKLNDETYLLKYSAYAAMINKTSVCQGYSNLLYRMLLTAGIDCRIITGISNNERHAWNIVEYNGKYYYLDATWDANIPPIGHNYFMKGTGDFENHWSDPEYETKEFQSAYPIAASGLSDADKIYKSGNYSYQVKNGYASIISYTGKETNVTIPASLGGYPVAEVALRAFQENKTAKTITVSEGITYIDMSGDTSFFRCEALEELNLPASLIVQVPSLEDQTVSGLYGITCECMKLKKVNVAAKNPYITSVDGVVYSKDKTALLCYPSAKAGTKFTVPSTVKIIVDSAFAYQENLQEVILPDSVEYIGYWAFNNVNQLKKINLPAKCRIIGQYAFQNTKLTSVHIPASMEWIMAEAFVNSPIESITLDAKNKTYRLVDGVLCTADSMVLYPIGSKTQIYQVPDFVEYLPSGIFREAKNLVQVTLGEKVKQIPEHAFRDCAQLQRVAVPVSVKEIGEYAFANCNYYQILYAGSEAQWKKITIGEGNEFDGRVYYNVTDVEAFLKEQNPFTDVPMESYYYEPVRWAASAGITQGVDATHFAPDNTCTRAQVVTFLWRSAGCPEPGMSNNPFVDVFAADYYYKAVLWAVENGITQGTDVNHFSPENPCTRAQVVTFLWRRYSNVSMGDAKNPFSDVGRGAYYYDAVLWAVENKITQGTDANHFSPENPCTRAQIVTFLYRDPYR